MTTTGRGPKPHRASPPEPAVDLVLSETAGRWDLVVHADSATAEALRAAGFNDGLALTVSVRPNLVPGQPFDVESVHVETKND